MVKVNKISDNIPLKMRMRGLAVKNQMKKNKFSNFVIRSNKKGELAVLVYNTPTHDELVMANVIKPDGTEKLSIYKTIKDKNSKSYSRIIETWDRVKDNLFFNKSTTIKYKDFYKVPESISVVYADSNLNGGVYKKSTFPLKKYMEHFQRPQA